MCGIAGLFAPHLEQGHREMLARDMHLRLQHRGPDGHGIWSDSLVTLAHRRLSIVDLSAAGAQPMASAKGDWVISFNGEIYNAPELRRRLDCNWRGHSDTEVITECLSTWGWEETLHSMNGMFALAAWQPALGRLYLARDRLGEKPLYYTHHAGGLYFASELPALLAIPDLPQGMDGRAVAALLAHRYIPAPLSILEGVQKLPAAHYLVFADNKPSLVCYWHLPAVGTRQISDTALSEEIGDRLIQAVKMRMMADVPLGAFLSGGIDSSSIVAAMQANSPVPIRTYTIGFSDARYDESPIARQITAALGTDHTEYYVQEQELLDIVPKLPAIYGEPFADFSQIPTAVLSLRVRQDVTVALAGDGGDELFGGYPRIHAAAADYRPAPRFWRDLAQGLAGGLSATLPFAARKRIKKLALFAQPDFIHYYALRCAAWHPLHRMGRHLPFPDVSATDADYITAANHFELTHYLPEDILTKVDRASMAASLEVRAPFLDHTLVEFLWALPPHQRTQQQPKFWLRQFLARQIPKLPPEIFTRPKQGFEPPLATWLRGPLHDWAGDLLAGQDDVINLPLARQYFQAMVRGKNAFAGLLWPILMLRQWQGVNAIRP